MNLAPDSLRENVPRRMADFKRFTMVRLFVVPVPVDRQYSYIRFEGGAYYTLHALYHSRGYRLLVLLAVSLEPLAKRQVLGTFWSAEV